MASGLGGMAVDQPIIGYDSNDATIVTAETNLLTGGIGFNGVIVDMAATPDDTNTAAYPVGTLFISPSA